MSYRNLPITKTVFGYEVTINGCVLSSMDLKSLTKLIDSYLGGTNASTN